MPKVVAYYAADRALTMAMQPAPMNFPAGEVTGDLMPHNSSNAAWNWRITMSAQDAPLYDIDKEPVGWGTRRGSETSEVIYERRSSNNRKALMDEVVFARREKDIFGKLFSALFSSPYASKMPSFQLYNNIDRLNFGQNYVDNSNVEAVAAKLHSYAAQGEVLAHNVIKANERGGRFNSPNVENLLGSVRNRRGKK